MTFTENQIARLWKAAKMIRSSTLQNAAKALLERAGASNDGSVGVDFSLFDQEVVGFLCKVLVEWKEHVQDSVYAVLADANELRRIVYGNVTKIAVVDKFSSSIPIKFAKRMGVLR